MEPITAGIASAALFMLVNLDSKPDWAVAVEKFAALYPETERGFLGWLGGGDRTADDILAWIHDYVAMEENPTPAQKKFLDWLERVTE